MGQITVPADELRQTLKRQLLIQKKYVLLSMDRATIYSSSF